MQSYTYSSKRKVACLFFLFFLILVFAALDLMLGSYDFKSNPLLISKVLSKLDFIVLYKLRLPKTLTAIAVGASLGISGFCFQTILKNPIANPFTLGISSAASCGAALSIISGFPFIYPAFNTMLSSIFFSLLCTSLMLFALIKKKLDARLMILFGVTLNFFFLACQSLLQYMADEKQSQQIIHWIFGSIQKASWFSVVTIAISFFLVCFLLVAKAWDLNLLSLSDDQAQSLGLNVNRSRTFFFFSCSIVTAIAISHVGTIGFIGLLSPHLSRHLLGSDARFSLIGSSLCGALILLLACILAKMLVPGGILPVGIITNILGVPFMALIVFGRGKK